MVVACVFAAACASATAQSNAQPQAEANAQARNEKALQAGYVETKELLRLMDKDKNGKVSKKEFMTFMEAEFDRLDSDKNGELDVEELSHVQVSKHTGGTIGR
jgi:hypothetical protein